MSIASELQRIQTAKSDVRQSIYNEFGIAIPESVTLDKYKYYLENNEDYLSFYCDEAGTIGWKASNSSITKTIQYSKDFGESWTNLTSTTGSGTTVAVNAGDIVWFKGSNTEYGTSSSYYNQFTLSNKVHVYGNVNSLTGNNTSVSQYCFSRLFYNCSKLYTYEYKKIILPATTLASDCYRAMFQGCSSLTTAPELPATTLAESCYRSMFNSCTSLTTVPELPATTLASDCYRLMFQKCTSLTTVPNNLLPATTLAVSCYCLMFQGCTCLTTAPELPATTLAEGCYQETFGRCTSLTTAPELPATTLAESCYRLMFKNCTSLTTAPELPATTLAVECYRSMFDGCTSLTTAPELPATTLVNDCYSYMFQNCTSLNYIKALFTTTPSSSYTGIWVSGVAPTGTFVKSAVATWDVTGNNGVPSGWKVYQPKLELASFGGIQIAPAPLYYNGTTFEIKDADWDHDSANSIYGKTEGSYYHNIIDLGQYFDSRGSSFTTSSGSIDNNGSKVSYGGYNDWRMPTAAEWCTLTTGASPGASRNGSNVNGTSGVKYAVIKVSGVTHANNQAYGVLLFPDDCSITGKTLNNVNNIRSNTLILNELQVYLNQKCVFLPTSGYYSGSSWQTDDWQAVYGMYWSVSEGSDSSYMKTLGFRQVMAGAMSNSLSPNSNTPKNSYYASVRLVR